MRRRTGHSKNPEELLEVLALPRERSGADDQDVSNIVELFSEPHHGGVQQISFNALEIESAEELSATIKKELNSFKTDDLLGLHKASASPRALDPFDSSESILSVDPFGSSASRASASRDSASRDSASPRASALVEKLELITNVRSDALVPVGRAEPEYVDFGKLTERLIDSFRENARLAELLVTVADAQRVHIDNHKNVPQVVDENITMTRETNSKVFTLSNKLEELQEQIKELSQLSMRSSEENREAFARQNEKQEKAAVILSSVHSGVDQANVGIERANVGIERVEGAVHEVGQDVVSMNQEVRVRFDAAAEQVEEFRNYAALRFDEVIGEIKRIGSWNSPCELILDRGVVAFLKSLIWCIYVFLRYLVKILMYIRLIYLEFKSRLFELFPENVMGIPTHWILHGIFCIMEWGAILLVLDKYIGPLIGIEDLASIFIRRFGIFIIEILSYVLKLFKEIWVNLSRPVLQAIIDILDHTGITGFFKELWSKIYDFFIGKTAEVLNEAKKKTSEIVSDTFSSALGLKGGGKKDILEWVKNAQKYGYLDIIYLSSSLNILSIFKLCEYVTDTIISGKIDPTFISFVSKYPEYIVDFKRNSKDFIEIFNNYKISSSIVIKTTPKKSKSHKSKSKESKKSKSQKSKESKKSKSQKSKESKKSKSQKSKSKESKKSKSQKSKGLNIIRYY